MSLVSGDGYNCVIPCGKWHPVVVRCLTQLLCVSEAPSCCDNLEAVTSAVCRCRVQSTGEIGRRNSGQSVFHESFVYEPLHVRGASYAVEGPAARGWHQHAA